MEGRMKYILIAYLISVLCNRVMNMADWCAKNKTLGVHGYYREHGWMVLKTFVLHVPLFALWYLGLALIPINAALVAAGVGALPGVTPLSSLAAGWVMDSIGSRIAKYVKAPQKNGGTV